MERIFIGIKVRSPESAVVAQLYQPLLALSGIKWVEMENLHMTLRFIGEVPLERRINIAKALEQVESKAFRLLLGNVSSFPKRGNPRVVHLGLKDESIELQNVKEQIDNILKSIEIPIEDENVFQAHVTLGRVKRIKGPEIKDFVKNNRNFEGPFYDVESFQLFRSVLTSSGPQYEVIQEYLLRG